jgi:hypothetical protein
MLFLFLDFVDFLPVFEELAGVDVLDLEESGGAVPLEDLPFLR